MFNINNLNWKQIKQLKQKSYKTKLLVVSEFVKPLFQKNENETVKQLNREHALNE